MGKKIQERNAFLDILDIAVSIYMLLLIVALPLYFQEGYTHIGTDKATFFRECSTKMWYLLVPLMVFGIGVSAIVKIVAETEAGTSKKKKGYKRVVAVSQEKRRFTVNAFVKGLYAKMKQMPSTYHFAALFVVALLLSYLCSDYKTDAVWGANGWFMGLIPQLMFVGIYLLIARFWNRHDWITFSILPVSFVVFLLGYLNRFGIYPIDMKTAQGLFLSTIGNINWFCGYIVSVFFIGFYFLWRRQCWKMWQQVLLSIYVLVGFAILIAQGSASGLVALGAVLLVVFCMSVSDGQAMENLLLEVVLLCLSCQITWVIRQVFPERFNLEEGVVDLLTNTKLPMIMTVVSIVLLIVVRLLNSKGKYPRKTAIACGYIAGIGTVVAFGAIVLLIWFNTTHPGVIGVIADNSLLTFNNEWGSNRGATWRAGWMCFVEQDWLHKLVGVGPDCMSAFIYSEGSEALQSLVKTKFHDATLTNAHMEWLTILINIGIIGAIAYIGMMVSAIIRFLKAGKRALIVGACGLCLLAFTINNMFSFQQSMSMATIFVVFGIGEFYYKKLEID